MRSLILILVLAASLLFAQDSTATAGSIWTPVLTAVGALLSLVATTLIGILIAWLKKKLP